MSLAARQEVAYLTTIHVTIMLTALMEVMRMVVAVVKGVEMEVKAKGLR